MTLERVSPVEVHRRARSQLRAAIGVIALSILPQPGGARSETKLPIHLAVFDFELEDLSAGANVTAGSQEDATQLRKVSDEVRLLIAQSKRYNVIDVDGASDPAVTAHSLRRCRGCDAAIAERLGADQSMTGIVSRMSRTEYQVTYTMREAGSGRILAVEQTDLRIGADYSWHRGAAWLIKNKLLAQSTQ
ncbi:DUF3280 domain-containing protein [Methylobacterium gnaphalii]|uniref:DUF2380 domain-containing protein n=1 Tax=Methylobacterium gnaphalii TaxID=1010610 RepID=A0A512JRR3_9HYPH|nr:DUF3280 domain-containing protein [Methylobacterium gnaphalii]GEP12640.1 hypothetical protein MGN01_44850 [Methylobacterium gnaphalii]GJD71775.1 hypothetical protein MMMDOFMJ_4740 [Methylobacterium gnaphalii]GLS48926.1 hypothetical protein GCM10007885_17730 [Methylobacterium gnaphalii]